MFPSTHYLRKYFSNIDKPVRVCCSRFAYHSNVKLSSEASQLLAHLAIQASSVDSQSNTAQELAMEAGTALETLIFVLKSALSVENLLSVKVWNDNVIYYYKCSI